MTEINSEGGQSYTIPLDSIDLKYLSKYVRTPNAEKMPLWTRKCLDGESEYCYIKIVTQDDNEDCYSEETFDTYNCHICNVEVPVLCFKKHNESEKHVTLKTIFQKVLERVAKQINISVINNDKDIDKDVYYCGPCSKIIKIENKQKHESSEYHVKSKKGITVVHEFYKIFEENKCYVGVKEVENEEILYENRDLSANKLGTDIIQNDNKNNNVKNEKKSNNDETKTVCSANDNTMKPTCSVENLVSNDKHNKELTSGENYFKAMVKKYSLKVNLPIVDDEFIHVASPSGIKVKISRNHFHSYLPIVGGIRVLCQMCNEPVDFGEESKHEVSAKHARNVFSSINEQFARTRNVYTSHCLICNTIVMTKWLFKHLVNDNHVKLLNSTKLTDICQNNEDLAEGINMKNNVERSHTEKHKIENHVNKSDENKKLNLSGNDSGDLNESGHIGRTKDAKSVQKLVATKLCNVIVPQDQNDVPKNDNVVKQNDVPKSDTVAKQNDASEYDKVKNQNDLSINYNVAKENETPKKQNDVSKNYNVAEQNNICKKYIVNNQYETPKNDNVTDQNNTLKNDNVTHQNDTPNKDNVTDQNNTLNNDNVTDQNDTPKNDNVTDQNNTLKNDNVTDQNDTNGNVTDQNNTLKNDNVAKQNNICKKYIVNNQYETPKNDNVTDQKNTLKNDNVTDQNNTLKNDNVAEQNNICKNYIVNNQYETPKNDNVTDQNNTLKNDNVTDLNDTPNNDNVTDQNNTLNNDNVTNQNNTLKNYNVTNQNNTLKNDNGTDQNDTPNNDNVTDQNNTLNNHNVTDQIDTPNNDNVTDQNNTLNNDNATNQTSTLKNDNVDDQNDRLNNNVSDRNNRFQLMDDVTKQRLTRAMRNFNFAMFDDVLEDDDYYFYNN